VYLKLRLLNEEAICSSCEELSSEVRQNRPILMRDLSIFGQYTYLKVPRRQFYCHHCQIYFTESLPFSEKGRQYTRRYEEYIYQQVQLSSIEQVSRVEGISFDRIQGIFKHQYNKQKKKDGKGSKELPLMKSVNVKDASNSRQLSEILKLESSSK
jgi:transposase